MSPFMATTEVWWRGLWWRQRSCGGKGMTDQWVLKQRCLLSWRRGLSWCRGVNRHFLSTWPLGVHSVFSPHPRVLKSYSLLSLSVCVCGWAPCTSVFSGDYHRPANLAVLFNPNITKSTTAKLPVSEAIDAFCMQLETDLGFVVFFYFEYHQSFSEAFLEFNVTITDVLSLTRISYYILLIFSNGAVNRETTTPPCTHV